MLVLHPERLERFLQKIDASAGPWGCWEWTGAKDWKGYGRFRVKYGRGAKSAVTAAHRVSAMVLGDVAEVGSGEVIMHTCDNRGCVNPEHLRVGTPQQNTDDMIAKGRQVVLLGERTSRAILTADDVRFIRRALTLGGGMRGGPSQFELARRFGVTKSAIAAIARGDTWAHVKPEDDPPP